MESCIPTKRVCGYDLTNFTCFYKEFFIWLQNALQQILFSASYKAYCLWAHPLRNEGLEIIRYRGKVYIMSPNTASLFERSNTGIKAGFLSLMPRDIFNFSKPASRTPELLDLRLELFLICKLCVKHLSIPQIVLQILSLLPFLRWDLSHIGRVLKFQYYTCRCSHER